MTGTNQVQDESTVQIYFPSDIRPAGIKDVVRSFIREAKMVCVRFLPLFIFLFFVLIQLRSHGMLRLYPIPAHVGYGGRMEGGTVINLSVQALAIVMECFSDVELLCDILVACKKRSAAVYLLLDRSNLNQFVDMWQELKLDGKNFPVSARQPLTFQPPSVGTC